MDDTEARKGYGVVAIDFENIWFALERALSESAFALLTPWMVGHEIREITRCIGNVINTSLFADFFALNDLFTKGAVRASLGRERRASPLSQGSAI